MWNIGLYSDLLFSIQWTLFTMHGLSEWNLKLLILFIRVASGWSLYIILDEIKWNVVGIRSFMRSHISPPSYFSFAPFSVPVAVAVDGVFSRGDLSIDSILFFFAISEFWYSSMHCSGDRVRRQKKNIELNKFKINMGRIRMPHTASTSKALPSNQNHARWYFWRHHYHILL